MTIERKYQKHGWTECFASEILELRILKKQKNQRHGIWLLFHQINRNS